MRALLSLFASCLALLLGAIQAESETWTPLTSNPVLEGAFRPGGAPHATFWEDTRNQTRSTFGTGPQGSNLGSFRTKSFSAPARFRCFVAGSPRTPGIRIYLRDAETGRELSLGSTLNPGLFWQERVWDVPLGWRGHSVSLQVDDGSTDPEFGWVALTLPEEGSHPAWLPFARAGYRSMFLVLELVCFLIPGIAAAMLLVPKNTVCFATMILISAALAGYASFWIYLAGPKAGIVSSVLMITGSIAYIWRIRRPLPKELAILFLTVALTGVCYTSLGFLFYTPDGPGEIAQARFGPEPLPPDNLLQYLFAWDVYNSHSVRPFLIANVHSSDRPPLETALSLEQYPFWRMLSVLHSYQLLGVALQCLWVAGVWVLLRASGISPSAVAAVLSLVFLTGFAWQHSFYIWPKLLSAAFCLLGLAAIPTFRGSSDDWSLRDAIAASAASSLSLLSHAGSGFTILAILLVLTVRRRLPPFRLAAIAITIALVLLVPWRAYQVLADPPGDTLFKLHLAGVADENMSLGASLLRSYGGLSSSQIASHKLANFKALFARSSVRATTDWKTTLLNLVDLSFFTFFPCAGVLNLGLLARLRLKRTSSQVRFADRLLLLTAIALVIWCLLMFEAGSTVVHQGSFATVLLYFTAMALYLHAWSRRAVLGVIAVQACLVFPVLLLLEPVITRPRDNVWNDPLDLGMATPPSAVFWR